MGERSMNDQLAEEVAAFIEQTEAMKAKLESAGFLRSTEYDGEISDASTLDVMDEMLSALYNLIEEQP
jgi:hypothetical protein